MEASILPPPARTGLREARPRRDRTAASVVPSPMSTTIAPKGSVTGIPAPMAAAIGSSIGWTRDAPALDAASRIARRSTVVDREGTHITISGRRGSRLGPPCAFWLQYLIICSARPEDHTCDLQTLMRMSTADF